MSQLQSEQIEREALLRALSASDDRPWCFIPLRSASIQWQSGVFQKMWAFNTGTDANTIGTVKTPATTPSIEDLVTSAQAKTTITIGQHDWFVDSVVVLDNDGRPVGRLFRLTSPEAEADHAAKMLASYDAQRRLTALSPREAEILDLVYDGLTNKAIAARANISQKTVEKHRGRVTRKLRTSSLAELIRLVATARYADVVSQDATKPDDFE